MLVGRGGGEHGGQKKKNSGTVTASLCLVCKWRGQILAPPVIKSINLLPCRKRLPNQDVLLCGYEFRDILIQGLQVTIAHEIVMMRLLG